MRKAIGMLVMLMGLTAHAQTNQVNQDSLYQEVVSQFFETGDLTSISGGKTQFGGRLTKNVGYGLGLTYENLSVSVVDYNTGVTYVYKMTPYKVQYTSMDSVKVIDYNFDSLMLIQSDKL